MMHPTSEIYQPLQEAYEFFNKALFGGQLPPCVLSLRADKQRFGYFAPKRFRSIADEAVVTDEVAMNPAHFADRPLKEILSTLVHEQCHVWQQHFGKPPTSSYHDKQWGQKMRNVGLEPSSTGAPGGRATGIKVSHYILPGGAYDRAYQEYERSGLTIGWSDIWMTEPRAKRKPKRLKFTCPSCGDSHQLIPTARLLCAKCLVTLLDNAADLDDEMLADAFRGTLLRPPGGDDVED